MSDRCKHILRALNSSDSQKRTYNTLLQLHSDVIKVENDFIYFKENGGINFLIQLLSNPNEKILNVALGILAECCIDIEGCNKVIAEGILKTVAAILRCINQDRTLYRCCKLLGNIAHHPCHCSLLMSNNIVELILPIVSAESSVSTQFVALRCLRYLWIGSSVKEKKSMIASAIFFNITKYIESTNKDVQKLVLQILLCLAKFRSDAFLKQLISDDFFTKIILKTSEFSSLILRIIYYLSDIRHLHFVMSKAGAVEAILSHLRGLNFKEAEINNEVDMNLVLRSLHRLCSEPRCRQKLCCIADAFDILLYIVENSSFVKFKKYSVLILCSFMYDEYSLKLLVSRRVIFGFVGYLQIITRSQGVNHLNDDMKNDVSISCGSPSSSGGFSPMSDSETSDAFCPSPTSESSAPSPAFSLDSVYSPVCSPAIDDIDEDEVDDSEKLSVDGCSSVAESPLIFQEDDNATFSTDEKIFNLLKQLTFRKEPIYDLCVLRTWDTLLDYLVLVRRTPNHLISLLGAIAGNSFFFFELLKCQFALVVNKKLCRPVHVDCNYCQEMNKFGNEILSRYEEVAESSYGQQILRNEIVKTSVGSSKIILALTIPHIVKNVIRLEEYLLRYKTLETIIESMRDNVVDDRNLLHSQVACLHSLASNVYLENPRNPCTLCKKCDVGSLTKEGTISFLLDDGSTVTANKRTICEKSEFFEAMFRCGFKEAKESVVRLSNISSDCLTVLFRLLYSYCDCIIPKNVVVLLELIVQSDRFLIPALSEKLLDVTMNCMLDYKNCHLIYDWAIENGRFLPSSQDLPIRQNVLKFVLVEKLSFNERAHAFKMLLKSRHKPNVLDDLSQIIECQLRCKDIQTKSSVKYIKETAAKRHKMS